MNNDLNWNSRRRTHMTLAIFATVVALAIIAALATTIHRVKREVPVSSSENGEEK